MKKLGIEALSCTHAAEQTGPCALCGAITPKCASTISAILRAANSPPRFSGSGCRIFTTSCLSNSANCCFVERLSPVAMGTGLRRATSTMAGMLVCGTGSSNHVGRNWWMASANSTAVATLKRQCPSISRSTGGPTASRTARMMSTARSKSYRERNRQLEPNGSNLSAVYPRAATSLALAAPQVIDGLIAGLADDVPQRDLNGRYRAHVDLRAFRVHIAHQALRDDLHLERVHPDRQRLQFVDGSLHRLAETVQRALAHPVDAFVRGHLGEYPVLPGIAGNVGVDGGDSHEGDCNNIKTGSTRMESTRR